MYYYKRVGGGIIISSLHLLFFYTLPDVLVHILGLPDVFFPNISMNSSETILYLFVVTILGGFLGLYFFPYQKKLKSFTAGFLLSYFLQSLFLLINNTLYKYQVLLGSYSEFWFLVPVLLGTVIATFFLPKEKIRLKKAI